MRAPHRLPALAAAATLVLTLTACGNTDDPKTQPTQATTPTQAATPTGSPSPTETPTEGTVSNGKWTTTAICPKNAKLTPFTGAAADKFGADNVMDAYCEIGDFFYTDAIRAAAPKDKWNPSELNFIYERLAPEAQKDVKDPVRRALATGVQSGDDWSLINTLTWFNLPLDSIGFSTDGGAVGQIGGGVDKTPTQIIQRDGRELLGMTLDVTTNFVLDKNGTEWVVPFTRKVNVALAPNPDPDAGDDRDWVISGWDANFSSNEKKAQRLVDYLDETMKD